MKTKSVMFMLIVGVFTLSSNMSAQNNISIMQTFVGDYGNSYLGEQMASLDFNRDGYCDLLMVQHRDWNTNETRTKILGYFGGVVLDTIPDLVLEAQTFEHRIGYYLLSAGDINGDGFEDLMEIERFPDTWSHYNLRFYYGGTNPDFMPDYEMILNPDYYDNPEVIPIQCIGDINHDGYDDIGVHLSNSNDIRGLGVLLGGSFQVVTIFDNVSSQVFDSITHLGDVNGDHIDDFMVGYAPNLLPDPPWPHYRYIYFGNDGYIDLSDRVRLPDSDDIFIGGFGIGDFNGDGYDDFTFDDYVDQTTWGQIFKLGSSSLPASEQYTVDNGYHGQMMNYRSFGVAHGDFNGDGFSDIVGANFEDMINSGKAGVWLGRANPNGLFDLYIPPPAASIGYQFGWAVTSGDFNNDGYCDFAISSPNDQSGSQWYPGYVYVYSGNAQLADTTVGNDDSIIPAASPVKLSIYPNPSVNKNADLSFKIDGDLPKDGSNAGIIIYNVKGQVLIKNILTSSDLQQGSGSLTAKGLNPGVYIAALQRGTKRISTAKFTIQ
jgi:hypothetical protein